MALTFDANHYLTHRSDVFQAFVATGGSTGLTWAQFAEQHYNNHGRYEGANPNAIFNTNEYLAANVDVAAAGVNPFQHYLTHGVYEGRAPNASFPKLGAEFDAAAYLAANSDLADAGIDTPEEAYAHFVLHGQFENRPGAPEVGSGTPGNSFTLTSNTAVLTSDASNGVTPAGTLTANNDKVNALNLLSNSVVIQDASTADNDTLDAIVSTTVSPLISNIENINLQFTGTGAGDFSMANVTGAKLVTAASSSSAAGTISGIDLTSTGTTFGIGSGKSVTLSTGTAAGTKDALSVRLAGTSKDTTLALTASVAGALETLSLESAGSAANTLNLGALTNFTGVTKTVVTGDQDLTLIADADGRLSGATAAYSAIDASGHKGNLTVQIGATSASTGITDTAISLTNYKGVDKVVLNDNTVVAVNGAASGVAVDLNSDLAFASFTIAGNSDVADAASNADAATINLTGTKATSDVTGALTFSGFETLTINSVGGVEHTIGSLSTTGSATALDTVNIVGNTKLIISGALAGVEKLDASGMSEGGSLTMGAAGANLLSLIGSSGNDVLYSGGNSASATVVDAGAGNDTVVFGAEKDDVRLGDGADIADISTLANIIGDGDVIHDFVSGTDKFKVGATVKGATTDATLTKQVITSGADLATALGNGTYTADAAHLVEINVAGAAFNGVYLVVNDNTAAFAAASDGVVKLVGVEALTAADFIA